MDIFSQCVNVGYSFHSVYQFLEEKCPSLAFNERFYSFVYSLALFCFYEYGDLLSHTSIALSALLIFLECNDMEEVFFSSKLIINQHLHLFGLHFSQELV